MRDGSMQPVSQRSRRGVTRPAPERLLNAGSASRDGEVHAKSNVRKQFQGKACDRGKFYGPTDFPKVAGDKRTVLLDFGCLKHPRSS